MCLYMYLSAVDDLKFQDMLPFVFSRYAPFCMFAAHIIYFDSINVIFHVYANDSKMVMLFR